MTMHGFIHEVNIHANVKEEENTFNDIVANFLINLLVVLVQINLRF